MKAKGNWFTQPLGLLLVVVLTSFLVSTGTAQEIRWFQTYGGPIWDQGYAIVEVSTGGFAITGHTVPFDGANAEFWLVRTDSFGNLLWSQNYGSADATWGRTMIECSNGGFALAGAMVKPVNDYWDMYILRTNPDGTILWNHTFWGLRHDRAESIIECSDGGYAVVGYTGFVHEMVFINREVWLIRLAEDGSHLWNQTFGGPGHDRSYQILEVETGGFVIVGHTASFGAGEDDVWLISTDENGNHLWNRTYGGPEDDWGWSITSCNAGGYAIVGFTENYGSSHTNVWLIRIDATGNTLWNQTYTSGQAFSLLETNNGDFIVAGITDFNSAGGYDAWVLRTNSTGHPIWSQTFGGPYDDEGYHITECSTGGFALTGYTESYGPGGRSMWLVRISNEGLPAPTISLLQIYGLALLVIIPIIILILFIGFNKMRKRQPTRSTGSISSTMICTIS